MSEEITYEERYREVKEQRDSLADDNYRLREELNLWRTNPKKAKLARMLDGALHAFAMDKDFNFQIKVNCLYIVVDGESDLVCKLEKIDHFEVYPDTIILKMSERSFVRLTEGGIMKCPELD